MAGRRHEGCGGTVEGGLSGNAGHGKVVPICSADHAFDRPPLILKRTIDARDQLVTWISCIGSQWKIPYAMTLLEVYVRKGSETPQLKNTGPMLEIMPGMEARYRLPNSCVGPQPCEPCGGENIAKSSKDRGCLAQWLSLVVNILRLIVEVFR